MRCPDCGEEVQEGVLVCPHCSAMLPMTDDTYDSYNTSNINNNYNQNYGSYNSNYNSYNDYNSGSYPPPSAVNNNNNYNRRPSNKFKHPVLIIFAVVLFIFIIYSATNKNGTYVYKNEGLKITLKVDGNKFTMKTYMAYSTSLGGGKNYMPTDEVSGKIKFVGSTAKLTAQGVTFKFKYNSSKKTITYELPTEYGTIKCTMKKKLFS